MKAVHLPLPELFGIAATRGILGAGVALLLSDHLGRERRRKLGAMLTLVGLLSTVPFAVDVMHRRES